MFVWPPMPLQPLDDGIDRKFAHSDRLALAMTIAPAAFSRWTMNASDGVLPASAHEPPVFGMPVVLTLSLTITGMPRSGRFTSTPRRRIRSARRASREGRRADRDDRVELRVQLLDPVEIELGQLDRRQLVAVHQRLELGDRRRVDVDAAARSSMSVSPRETDRGRQARHPEQERHQRCQNRGNVEPGCSSRVTSTGSGGRVAGVAGAIWGFPSNETRSVKGPPAM